MWNCILDCDRLVEVAVAQHIEDRREGFLEDTALVRVELNDRGTYVEAAGHRIDALDALPEHGFHAVECGLVDQRTDQRARLTRVADLCLSEEFPDALDQLIGDAVMDDHTPERRAALPCGTRRREQDRPRSQFEISTRADNH